jgi:hypothetical protein
MENLAQFKTKLTQLSLEELYDSKKECENALANMVFNGDLVVKLTLIEEEIDSRKGENNG